VQQAGGGWSLSLLAALAPSIVIALASISYAARRRTPPALLLAVGAAGQLIVTVASLSLQFLLLPTLRPASPERFLAGQQLVLSVQRWLSPAFGLVFALGLFFVLRGASRLHRQPPTEQALPADGGYAGR
jgi:hypothetical protein